MTSDSHTGLLGRVHVMPDVADRIDHRADRFAAASEQIREADRVGVEELS
jgi:hypothetical protein